MYTAYIHDITDDLVIYYDSRNGCYTSTAPDYEEEFDSRAEANDALSDMLSDLRHRLPGHELAGHIEKV